MFSRYPCSDTKLVNVTLHRTVYSQQYTKQTPYYVTLSAAVDFKYRRMTRKSFKSATKPLQHPPSPPPFLPSPFPIMGQEQYSLFYF